MIPFGSPISIVDEHLAKWRLQIIAGLVLFSLVFRVVYFTQLSAGPCILQHRWEESDMNFFDVWAKKIAAGDWWTNEAVHPLMNWQRRVSQIALTTHPELKTSLEQESAAGGEKDIDRLLWNRWYGEKAFHQEPLYPYMVAITYRIFGNDVRWVFAWQMVLGIGSILLIYTIARRQFGDLVGLLAALTALLYAPLLFYELLLLRDSTLVFFTLAMLWTCGLAVETKKPRFWFLFGVTAGLTMLLKSTVVIFLLGAFLVSIVMFWSQRALLLRCVAIALGGVLLSLSPCIVRNIHVGTAPFALSNSGLPALALCIYDTSEYPEDMGEVSNLHYVPEIMTRSNGQFLPAVRETLDTYKDTWSVIRMFWHKFTFIWHWYEIPNNENFYYYALHARILSWLPATFGIMAPFAIVGLVISARRITQHWPLHLLILTSLPPLLLASIYSRYRAPLAAALIPLAALTLVALAGWLLQKRLLHAAVCGVSIAVLMLWIDRPLSPREPLIRYADYAEPYNYYYRPVLAEAMKTKDWTLMQRVIQDALICEPGFVKGMDADHRAQGQYEIDLASLFAKTHLTYALCLNAMQQPDDAALHTRRANELSKAAAP